MTAKTLQVLNVVFIIAWILTMPWVWITASGLSIAAFFIFLLLIGLNVTGVLASLFLKK